MKYKILRADTAEELTELVNDLIKEGFGWHPIGGIAVCKWYETWENQRKGYQESETYSVYAQAMLSEVSNG